MSRIVPFEPEPFTRIIWRWGAPAKYRVAVEKASGLAHKAEYQMVVQGYRPCDVVHIYPETMYEQLNQFEKDGLYFIPIRKAKRVSGFAHKFYEPTKPSEVMIYGVVSRKYLDAKKFAEAHKAYRCDHYTVGKLLGYPECCIRFFCKHFTSGMYDLIPLIEGEQKYPELNIMLRYFGVRAIPFFPCRWDCDEAKKFADKFVSLMREEDPKTTDLILELLEMPCRWSMNKAVIQVDHLLFIGLANGFWLDHPVEKWWRGGDGSFASRWGDKFSLQTMWLYYTWLKSRTSNEKQI